MKLSLGTGSCTWRQQCTTCLSLGGVYNSIMERKLNFATDFRISNLCNQRISLNLDRWLHKVNCQGGEGDRINGHRTTSIRERQLQDEQSVQ